MPIVWEKMQTQVYTPWTKSKTTAPLAKINCFIRTMDTFAAENGWAINLKGTGTFIHFKLDIDAQANILPGSVILALKDKATGLVESSRLQPKSTVDSWVYNKMEGIKGFTNTRGKNVHLPKACLHGYIH